MKKCNIINNRREAIYYEEDDNYNRFNYIVKNIDIIKISLPTYIVNTYFIFFILFFTFISKKDRDTCIELKAYYITGILLSDRKSVV